MKTTIVPAQITTVEDRIAGNWTFNQILLLIVPLITSTAVYALMSPRSHMNSVKFFLIILQFLIFAPLTIRVNGKILGSWLIIFLGFKARPRIYVFTKNDHHRRDFTPIRKERTAKEKSKVQKKESLPSITFSEQAKFDKLITDKSFNIRFNAAKKGGVDVSLSEQEV